MGVACAEAPPKVAADGTFGPFDDKFECNERGHQITDLRIGAETAAGTVFKR
jgi:hypothetical protein